MFGEIGAWLSIKFIAFETKEVKLELFGEPESYVEEIWNVTALSLPRRTTLWVAKNKELEEEGFLLYLLIANIHL